MDQHVLGFRLHQSREQVVWKVCPIYSRSLLLSVLEFACLCFSPCVSALFEPLPKHRTNTKSFKTFPQPPSQVLGSLLAALVVAREVTVYLLAVVSREEGRQGAETDLATVRWEPSASFPLVLPRLLQQRHYQVVLVVLVVVVLEVQVVLEVLVVVVQAALVALEVRVVLEVYLLLLPRVLECGSLKHLGNRMKSGYQGKKRRTRVRANGPLSQPISPSVTGNHAGRDLL